MSTITLKSCYYSPHSTDEEIQVWQGYKKCSRSAGSGTAETQTHTCPSPHTFCRLLEEGHIPPSLTWTDFHGHKPDVMVCVDGPAIELCFPATGCAHWLPWGQTRPDGVCGRPQRQAVHPGLQRLYCVQNVCVPPSPYVPTLLRYEGVGL